MSAVARLVLPRLMKEPEAARYLGVSTTTLRGLGLPRRILGGLRLYDVYDLDAFASSLPFEDREDRPCENPADKAFGCVT